MCKVFIQRIGIKSMHFHLLSIAQDSSFYRFLRNSNTYKQKLAVNKNNYSN